MSAKQRLFNATRSYSQLLVGVAVILSLFFTAFLGSDNLNWQISLAVIALNPDNSRLLWSILVVIWALTVPHMMVTAKLDKGALLGK